MGNEEEKCLQMSGLNLINKTLLVHGARISFSIWDVGGTYIHVKGVFGVAFDFLLLKAVSEVFVHVFNL